MSKELKAAMEGQTVQNGTEPAPSITSPAAEQLETQLSSIITSAQQIAVIAEELLRDFSTPALNESLLTISPARLRQTIQAAAMAPRLLAATQQQLDSLLSMLRDQ